MRQTIKRCAIALSISSALLAGTAYASSDAPLTANVGYVQMSNLPVGANKISPIRFQAIRETATQLGANGALAYRSQQIDLQLNKAAEKLNHAFDFNQLMLKHSVLPPVLVESDNSLNLSGDDAIRLASKTYKIEQQAKFVTAPPNWRSYLYMHYNKPKMPDHTLLPQTQAEANVWNAFLKKGWKEGLQQGNEIFAINLNRLKRDYAGMLLYRNLLAQHMVSAPYVSHADLGVTGNANEIHINDQVLRITAVSKLQTDISKWTPILAN